MSSSPPTASLQVEQSEPRRTSIVFAEPTGGRRSSNTAVTSTASVNTLSSSTLPGISNHVRDRPRSLSSPPPPPSFLKRVGFDTFDNKDASDFSLTLKTKHKDYSYTRRSRTFLCGTDQNDYSEFALEWLIDELVDDGDEIVCLRVVDKDFKVAGDSERTYRAEARTLMNQIIEKNDEDKAISIILEFSVGKVHDTIQKMILIYEPVILIVGTRGRSLGGLQGLLPGSVSKYCLQHSPVPVIVVRPSTKREKKKKKRLADPNRRMYQEIIEKSSPTLGGLSRGVSRIGSGDVSSASVSSIGDTSIGDTSIRGTTLAGVTEGVATCGDRQAKAKPDTNGDISPGTVPVHVSGEETEPFVETESTSRASRESAR